MLYQISQWVGGIALHWFYKDVRAVHAERIPRTGPLLVAMNHQNALVDVIVAQWVVPRRLRMTAKSTLANNVFGALLVKLFGIIPLRRVSDERKNGAGQKPLDPMRNRRAFTNMIQELARGGAILIFPEGKSHNDPTVAPLKTGIARAALWAREAGVHHVKIVPIGLTFEQKAAPGTVVVAQIGEVIDLDAWTDDDPQTLTDAVEDRLRTVSLTADVGIPPVRPRRSWLVRLAAWWGRVTHWIPIELARRLALAKSTNEDEPAMYTMTYGLALTLLAYAIQLPVVWIVFNPTIGLIYLTSLLIGAYWAAYAEHD